MSPEQARGLDIDARSGIFSLGLTPYEMAAHQRHFYRRAIELDPEFAFA